VLHFNRSPSDASWIACVPSGALVRFARVERRPEGQRPAVRWLHEQPWNDAPRALRQARRAGQLGRYRCVALLQRQHYQLLPMDAPDVPREDWRAAVRWKIKDMVEFPVETAGASIGSSW